MPDPHHWVQALDTLYDHAWQLLIRDVHDRHAPGLLGYESLKVFSARA